MPPGNLTYIHNNILTTNGDIITRQSGEAARLGVGSDDQVLTVVSGAPAWADASGGSSSGIWEPDAKPASAGADDDEFADNSAGVPGGWTEVDHGADVTVTENEQGLLLTSSGGSQVAGIYKAIPAGDFTIWTKVNFTEFPSQFLGGLTLFEDATSSSGDMYTFGFDSNGPSFAWYLWNAYNSFGGTVNSSGMAYSTKTAYFRVRRSTATYAFDISYNGIVWTQRASGTISWTPAHYGLHVYGAGGSTQRALFPFFRYLSSDVGVAGVAKGKRM